MNFDPDNFDENTLVIGITGHRNLRIEELPSLRKKVESFFAGLKLRFPHLRLRLLTSLASGSDQLVAQIAIDLNIEVIAPLPIATNLYRDDFTTEQELRDFDALLPKVKLLPLPVLPSNNIESIVTPGFARNMQYAHSGVFISSHCHILLALWDGKESNLLGGTGQIVSYHLHGIMPDAFDRRITSKSALGVDEETVVYHIQVNRADSTPVELAPPVWLTADQQITEHTEIPERYALMLDRHTGYCHDVHKYQAQINRIIVNNPEQAECPIHKRFRAADWLAATYQHRVARALLWTYLLTALMGFMFIGYSDMAAQDVLLYMFLIFFIALIVINRIASHREWHRKYIDYRALAEGLRVQSYSRRAGISDTSKPSFAHDNFLQKQDVELGWIRNMMRTASIDGMLTPADDDAAHVDAVIKEWIGTPESPGQLQYYNDTALRRTRNHKRNEAIANCCLWLGIAISVVLAIFAKRFDGPLQNLLVAIMGALSVAAAVHEAYAYKKADKELIKQYRFMLKIFTAAERRLTSVTSIVDRRKILNALGEASLAEHAEWTLMHRERPLEKAKL